MYFVYLLLLTTWMPGLLLPHVTPGKMNKPLNKEDIAAMESQLKQSVEEDRKYWRVNTVKCDAIHTAKTYEEFADRVAAAHLRPLDKADFTKKVSRGWNQYATPDPRE